MWPPAFPRGVGAVQQGGLHLGLGETKIAGAVPGSGTVEIARLIPDGAATIVRLTHRDLPSTDRGSHADGWGHFLPRLAVAAAGGDPGSDPWVTTG